MKTYQRAFGIDWQDSEDNDGFQRYPTKPKRHNRAQSDASSLPPRPLANRSVSRESQRSTEGQSNESLRIEYVRESCLAQNKALSLWWKVAIQANVKSRMWMQLGSAPSEAELPPRFERLYQPEKIAQFDRFFARGWATPVRRSHSAQHTKGSSDDETGWRDFRRSVHSSQVLPGPRDSAPQDSAPGEDSGDHQITKALDSFVSSYGLQPHFKPTMKSFVKHHDIRYKNSASGRSSSGSLTVQI